MLQILDVNGWFANNSGASRFYTEPFGDFRSRPPLCWQCVLLAMRFNDDAFRNLDQPHRNLNPTPICNPQSHSAIINPPNGPPVS
jgi:hypothetical protein